MLIISKPDIIPPPPLHAGLPAVPPARPHQVINGRLIDVMLYLMPHRDTLLRAVQRGLNRAYLDYLTSESDADPAFDPAGLRVLLYAHSLGSVMCYDLLSEPGALHFPVHTFCALGSPLGLFLATRGVALGGLGGVFPPGAAGAQFVFNVLHPYDPLAYRLEPFVDAALRARRPVTLPHPRTGGDRPGLLKSMVSGIVTPLSQSRRARSRSPPAAAARPPAPAVKRAHLLCGRFDFLMQVPAPAPGVSCYGGRGCGTPSLAAAPGARAARQDPDFVPFSYGQALWAHPVGS